MPAMTSSGDNTEVVALASPHFSPGREARARRWLYSQGERESGRAGVPVGTSSTPKQLCRVQRSEYRQIRVRSRELVRNAG